MKKFISEKKPLFPNERWKQYDEAGGGLAQTTNNVEGWHYELQGCISGSTPKTRLLIRTSKTFENIEVSEY